MPTTPETWRSRFTVNSSPDGGSTFEPRIVQLANGNVLVAWTSNKIDGAGTPPGRDILARILDPLGNLIGSEFRLNESFTDAAEVKVEIAPLPNGGFVVVYLHGASVTNDVVIDEFNASGVLQSSSPTVQTDPASGLPIHTGPVIAASSSTNVLVSWYQSGGDVGEGVVGRFYNPSTDTYGSKVLLLEDATFRVWQPAVAVLNNGNYVVTGDTDSGGDIVYRIINPNGNNVLSQTPTGSDTAENRSPDVLALAGGGFVIAWTADNNADLGIRAQVFNAAGAAVSGLLVPPTTTAGNQFSPEIAALADGGFVVVWFDGPTTSIRGQRHSATGAKVGTEFTVEAGVSLIGDRYHDVVGLDDGRFAVTWADLDGGVFRVRTAIFDVRDTVNAPVYAPDQWQVGTVGDDTFTTGTATDITHGWDGDDVITDGAGAVDQIHGDSGNDRIVISGVTTGELADGGAGIDTLVGVNMPAGTVYNLAAGTVTSTAPLAAQTVLNFENVTGASVAETLIGSAAFNRLDGGGGNDTIIDQDLGVDHFVGGSGVDTLIHDLAWGSDTTFNLLLGHRVTSPVILETFTGIENLTVGGAAAVIGSAADNVITITETGLLHANALSGGAGNDTLNAGSGNDVLAGGLGNDAFNGGAGTDTADFSAAAGPITVDLTIAGPQNTGEGLDTFTGIENIIGSPFADLFIGQNLSNLFQGGGGDDELRGGSGNDALNGDIGNDLVVADAGDDIVDGGGGLDRLYGGSGNDTIFGGGGADTLVGGPGIDRLDGGDDPDRLYGDATADTFVFARVGGDRVFSFVSGLHTLEIDGDSFGGVAGAFAFVQGATPTPVGALQALLYDTDDGKLYFDADGAGAGARVHVLTLVGAPLLAAGDIVLV